MSVENFDGPGLSDQPSIIYGYTDAQEDLHIKELSRSGYGEPGPSPGDIIDRDSTESTLDTGLPALSLPGSGPLQYDDCGEDIPAFACADCASPTYVGRTCYNPLCERGWASAVKAKTIRAVGKCWAMEQILYQRNQENIDHNHVVASMPDFLVDSDEPINRAIEVLKTLLKYHWGIEDFVAIYHPYRIRKEYRKDQYEHGGEPGEGDMTWKDVLSSDDPEEYIYHSPHFHLFFPARRKQFDYSVVEYVNSHSGWSFHRITKGDDDVNISVENLDDLVHQMTYCLSHTGVRLVGPRNELATRLKGEIHNLYVPDGIVDDITASFCDAAPKLLGVSFANLSDATCDAEVSDDSGSDGGQSETEDELPDSESDEDDVNDHPLYDVFEATTSTGSQTRTGGSPWNEELNADGVSDADSATADDWAGTSGSQSQTLSRPAESAATGDDAGADSSGGSAADGDEGSDDNQSVCGGDLEPIWDARDRLDDERWCEQAPYVSALRTAVEEWERRTDGESEVPWVGDRANGDDDIDTSRVVRPPD